MKDRCQKCGEEGEDMRTLWMACFYDMSELKIPFEQCAIEGKYHKHIGDKESPFGFLIPEFKEVKGAELRKHQFYSLRVCKDCRASWMQAIKIWFDKLKLDESTGSGYFKRELGSTKEI